MYGRFSRPVLPGDSLVISIWIEPDGASALFRTALADGTVVIDRGRMRFGPPAETASAAAAGGAASDAAASAPVAG